MSFPTSPFPSNWFSWSIFWQSNRHNLQLKYRKNWPTLVNFGSFWWYLNFTLLQFLKRLLILFSQWQVRDFERNGLNLTTSKREELLRLRVQIEELSLRYIQNLNDDGTFIPFSEVELDGLPKEFFEVWVFSYYVF